MALTQSRCCVCKGPSARGCQRVQSKGCCTLQQLYPLSLLFSSVIAVVQTARQCSQTSCEVCNPLKRINLTSCR